MSRLYRPMSWLAVAIRLLLAFVFVLSALGKLLDQSAAAVGMNKLMGLPYSTARLAVIALSVAELLIALALFSKRFLRLLIAVPVLFLIIVLYTNAAGIDCGCFGALPVLSQFSFSGHLLLLAGMFVGIGYLILISRHDSTDNEPPIVAPESHRRLTAIGIGSLALLLMAFLTLPLAPDQHQTESAPDFPTVDRLAVEANISSRAATLIDARSQFEYEIDHIEGAISIPFDQTGLDSLVNRLELRSKAIIVYCSGVDCPAAETLAGRLREYGCNGVSIYPGGWEEWIEFY